MNLHTKLIALMLAAFMVLIFAACAGSSQHNNEQSAQNTPYAQKTEAPQATPEIEPTVYDTGRFTVKVPDGWTAVPMNKLFAEDEVDEFAVYLVNSPEVDDINDILYASDTTYVIIRYTEPDDSFVPPNIEDYIDVEEIAPVFNGVEWQGFYGRLVYPAIVLWDQRDNGSGVLAEIYNYPEGILQTTDLAVILSDVAQ